MGHGTLVPLLQGYTQLKQLGSGAASKAYLARGNADNQMYVIKQVRVPLPCAAARPCRKGGGGACARPRAPLPGWLALTAAPQVQCIGGKYNAGTASYVLQECRLLFQLKHPNIVEMKDFYPQKDNLNLVLEYCDCGDLGVVTYKAIKNKTPIPMEKITSWFVQVGTSVRNLDMFAPRRRTGVRVARFAPRPRSPSFVPAR